MLTVILLSVAVCLLVFIFESTFRKSQNIPPGPFQWPVIGNIRLMRALSRKHSGQHNAFIELSKQYASKLVSLRLGGTHMIAASGYNEIQAIFSSEEFDGRPWNEFIKLRNMGLRKGITMTDGPEWKEVRSWFVRALRQVGFGRAEMYAHLNEEVEHTLARVGKGGTYRIKELLSPAMINVIWTLATGKRMGDEEKMKHFIELMERRAAAFDMAGGLLSTFPWMRYVAPQYSGYNILVAVNNQLKELLMGAIEEHKKRYVPGQAGGDLIDLFLEEMYNGKGRDSIFNEEQLFVILLDLFIAGSITATSTLDFLFMRMTAHQDIQRRLHKELDSVIGHDRPPNLNDRPNLPYLEAILTESQRLQPVVPIIGPRRVMRETRIDGYRIPKESCILINIWSVHMDPEFFPEPETFNPDRFIKDGAHNPDDKLIFFGRGKRRCPGEADAKSAVFLFFASFMQRFQLLPAPGQEPMDVKPMPGLTLSPKPYRTLLVPRQ